ncbi:MAG TPA: glutathione S-transferase family protein [Deltaproteobacteria bacterium]|nr:glutathione S-transferase family protein [Deltaproteobacteria bacterium]
MSELILHHYDMSPYAEKIRLALGLKRLHWRSVQTPMVLPKPDHMELTGGYRRVPVLQIGADIYCDTHLIVRVLDRIRPDPPLSPPGLETIEHAFSRWAETNFMMAILAFFGIGGIFPEEFVEDRKKTMIPPGMDLDGASAIVSSKLLQLRSNVLRLESMLRDGRLFMLGGTASAADLSAYHPLMMLGMHERTRAQLEGAPYVAEWMERVRSIGHGESRPLESAEAIAIARQSDPAGFDGEPVVPEGMKLGSPVLVLPDEYGSGNVTGALAPSDIFKIAVRRKTERAGEVVVHFPREDHGLIALP